MIRISTEEKHSRYLAYSRYGPDRFTPWLKKIGIDKLPYGLTPIDFVEQGWITPTLRIDPPDSYFLSWENYPFALLKVMNYPRKINGVSMRHYRLESSISKTSQGMVSSSL